MIAEPRATPVVPDELLRHAAERVGVCVRPVVRRIIDNKTKEDLTSVTLAQIIFEEEKKQKSFLPLQAMRNIIQSGGESISQFVTQAQKRVSKSTAKSAPFTLATKTASRRTSSTPSSGTSVSTATSAMMQAISPASPKVLIRSESENSSATNDRPAVPCVSTLPDDPRSGKWGKQRCEDTGPLTRKRMETIDEEVLAQTVKFIDAKQAEIISGDR